jgi:hypothetical protein
MPIEHDTLISRHDTHVGDGIGKSLTPLSHYPQMWVSVLGVCNGE